MISKVHYISFTCYSAANSKMNNSEIVFVSPSIIIPSMFIQHFFFFFFFTKIHYLHLVWVLNAPSPCRPSSILSPLFLLDQLFLTVLASLLFRLPYLSVSLLFSSLSLFVSLCNCVAFCAVFCACHPRKQTGRSPPSPQRQRAAQPYEYKYKICIQSDVRRDCGWQESAALEVCSRRTSGRIGKTNEKSQPRSGHCFRPTHSDVEQIQNELSSDIANICPRGSFERARWRYFSMNLRVSASSDVTLTSKDATAARLERCVRIVHCRSDLRTCTWHVRWKCGAGFQSGALYEKCGEFSSNEHFSWQILVLRYGT